MRVLIVGNMEGHVSTAAQIAMKRGATVVQVDNLDKAIADLRAGNGADMVLIDLEYNISDFIKRLKNERIATPVIACGISVSPQAAAAAIRAGAQEYIPLPPDPELIAAVLEAVTHVDTTLLYKDPEMQQWVKMADKIAPSEANILITGESGTGKEVMARYVHAKSRRAKKPFISLNCAAIPESLLESELFGHEKGAFTGAIARRIGKFEEAEGGTLLLDEISEMHPRLQAKLLRAIQERVIDRVGGTKPIPVNIRIIATSNRDLLEASTNGDFREDLYFRLNVVNIHLPPLRQRTQDIELLARYFIKKYATLNCTDPKEFSTPALGAIKSHTWRGNVRELENCMHRALLLSPTDTIETDDIFPVGIDSVTKVIGSNGATQDSILIGKSIAEVERDLILGTLNFCSGNRTHAANILGISIRTLRNKLKEYAQSLDNEDTLPYTVEVDQDIAHVALGGT